LGKSVELVLVILVSLVVVTIVIAVSMSVAIVAVVVAISMAAVLLGLAGRQVAVSPAGLFAVVLGVVVVAVVVPVLVFVFVAIVIPVLVLVFVFVPVVIAVFVMIPVVIAMGKVIAIIAIVIVPVAVVLRQHSYRQQGTAQTCHDERFQRSLKHTSSLVEMRLEAAGGLNSMKQLYRGMLPVSTPFGITTLVIAANRPSPWLLSSTHRPGDIKWSTPRRRHAIMMAGLPEGRRIRLVL
jgi:hypothetical protein